MRRREALKLLVAGGGTTLVAGCFAPRADSEPTLPSRPTADVPPTSLPTLPPHTSTSIPPTAPATATPVPTLRQAVAPTARPTAATPEGLARAVDTAMQRAIQANVLPGGVALVQHKGTQIMLEAYGLSHKYDSIGVLTSEPISARSDTLYDLASITKLFTTTAVMRLVELGRLALDKPVAGWLSEFAEGGKERVTLRHLLTHTSGMPALVELWKLEPTPEARLQRVLAEPLRDPPGSVLRYSDLGLIAVGHTVEQVAGSSLDRVIHELVIGPLRLDHTLFRPATESKARIGPTEVEEEVGRGMVWGEVDDENCWSLGGVAGHAGLFGTAQDLGRLAQLYLEGGSLDGVRLLTPETVAEMTRNQIGKLGWRGLGWELNADYYMGRLASPRTYGHTGFTGTSMVVDPTRQLIVVLLTNRVHPTADGPSPNATRQAVANAALEASVRLAS